MSTIWAVVLLLPGTPLFSVRTGIVIISGKFERQILAPVIVDQLLMRIEFSGCRIGQHEEHPVLIRRQSLRRDAHETQPLQRAAMIAPEVPRWRSW